jgi:hypothetical protein
MSEHLEQVREWVAEVLTQGCVLVELRARMGDRRVRNWQSLPSNGEADKLAGEMVRAAERDAKNQNLPDVAYLLLAFKNDPPANPSSDYVNSCTIELAGKGKKPGSSLGEFNEQATMAAAMQNATRQSENLHRLFVTNAEKLDERREAEVIQLRARVSDLEKELRGEAVRRLEMVAVAEDLATQRWERERDRWRMRLDERKQDMFGEQLEQLFPIALNRLMGGGKGKGAAIMGETILMKLLASMSKTQMDAFMQGGDPSLTPEQKIMLGELYMSYGEKFERLKANRKHETFPDEETNGVTPPGAGAPPAANGAAAPPAPNGGAS